jgi:hypothetical protein
MSAQAIVIYAPGRSDIPPVYRFMTRDIATVATQLGFIASIYVHGYHKKCAVLGTTRAARLLQTRKKDPYHGNRQQFTFLPIQ